MKLAFELRILLYSGDTDSIVNFASTEAFVAKLWTDDDLLKVCGPDNAAFQKRSFQTAIDGIHSPWHFRSDIESVAGWVNHFVPGFDFLTVKVRPGRLGHGPTVSTAHWLEGAGHFVPADKPAQSLQMMGNFLQNASFGAGLHVSVTPAPHGSHNDTSPTLSPLPPSLRREIGDATTTTTPLPATTPPPSGSGAVTGLSITLALFILLALGLAALLYREKRANAGYGTYIN